jgi:hypothetical protein
MKHPNAQNFDSHAYCPEISEIRLEFTKKGEDINGHHMQLSSLGLGCILTVALIAWGVQVQHKHTTTSPNESVEFEVLAICETRLVYLALLRSMFRLCAYAVHSKRQSTGSRETNIKCFPYKVLISEGTLAGLYKIE